MIILGKYTEKFEFKRSLKDNQKLKNRWKNFAHEPDYIKKRVILTTLLDKEQ